MVMMMMLLYARVDSSSKQESRDVQARFERSRRALSQLHTAHQFDHPPQPRRSAVTRRHQLVAILNNHVLFVKLAFLIFPRCDEVTLCMGMLPSVRLCEFLLSVYCRFTHLKMKLVDATLFQAAK